MPPQASGITNLGLLFVFSPESSEDPYPFEGMAQIGFVKMRQWGWNRLAWLKTCRELSEVSRSLWTPIFEASVAVHRWDEIFRWRVTGGLFPQRGLQLNTTTWLKYRGVGMRDDDCIHVRLPQIRLF